MAEVLIPPDVEAVYQSYLRTSLAARGWTVKVASTVPATRPQYMVKVTLTGGSTRSQISHEAQLTVECWADDSVKASELSRLCHGLTIAMQGAVFSGVWVRAARPVSGPTFFPDPDTSTPRYQFTTRLDVRPLPA